MKKKFQCLVADPPWEHRDQGIRGGTARQYETLSTEKICEFKIPPLADDCWLFLWVTHNHTLDAFDVAKAWGFNRYRSEGIWAKMTKSGDRLKFGGGHTLRQAHEKFFLFSRGKPLRNDRSLPSVILAPHPRRKDDGKIIHSAKPAKFYVMVDRFCDGPKAELFARRQWADWTCLGNGMPGKKAA
jgi:N6-adenosine-specific RNA methylase IME4